MQEIAAGLYVFRGIAVIYFSVASVTDYVSTDIGQKINQFTAGDSFHGTSGRRRITTAEDVLILCQRQ